MPLVSHPEEEEAAVVVAAGEAVEEADAEVAEADAAADERSARFRIACYMVISCLLGGRPTPLQGQ
jgi:hypothetical protein